MILQGKRTLRGARIADTVSHWTNRFFTSFMQPAVCRARLLASALPANNRHSVGSLPTKQRRSNLHFCLPSGSRRLKVYHAGRAKHCRLRAVSMRQHLHLLDCSISCERVGVGYCEPYSHRLHRPWWLLDHGGHR